MMQKCSAIGADARKYDMASSTAVSMLHGWCDVTRVQQCMMQLVCRSKGDIDV